MSYFIGVIWAARLFFQAKTLVGARVLAGTEPVQRQNGPNQFSGDASNSIGQLARTR